VAQRVDVGIERWFAWRAPESPHAIRSGSHCCSSGQRPVRGVVSAVSLACTASESIQRQIADRRGISRRTNMDCFFWAFCIQDSRRLWALPGEPSRLRAVGHLLLFALVAALSLVCARMGTWKGHGVLPQACVFGLIARLSPRSWRCWTAARNPSHRMGLSDIAE